MSNVDVELFKSGHRVGLAALRPIRVTPVGTAGIVYRGKVFPLRLHGEGIYAVEVLGTCYKADVCRLATHAEAVRLLGDIASARSDSASQHRTKAPTESPAKAQAVAPPADSGGSAVAEILGLLSLAQPRPKLPPPERER